MKNIDGGYIEFRDELSDKPEILSVDVKYTIFMQNYGQTGPVSINSRWRQPLYIFKIKNQL